MQDCHVLLKTIKAFGRASLIHQLKILFYKKIFELYSNLYTVPTKGTVLGVITHARVRARNLIH